MKRVIVLILLLGSFSAQGQQKQMLTLDRALEITMKQNPELEALRHEEEAAEKEKKAAFGLRLPSVSVGAAYAYMGKDIGIGFNDLKTPVQGILGGMSEMLPPVILGEANALMAKDWGLKLQDRSFATVGGTVTLPVFTGGKINAANKAAKLRIEEAAAKGSQGRNSLVSELAERYFGLSLAMQVVEVRKQVWEGMQQHLSDARQLEANGIIAKVERLYAEVHTAEAERDYLKALHQVETLNSALGNTLNSNAEYLPASCMFILREIENVDYFKEMALANNPQLKQVDVTRNLAKEAVRLQRADFMPQVALMGGGTFYNYQVTKVLPRWAVGAGITLKIFDGLNREYKFGAAKSQVKQVEAIKVTAHNNILTLIDKLYYELITYSQQLPSLETSAEFSQEYLRMKEEAFKEGIAPSSDVVDARLNLAKVKTERLQAGYYYDLMLAKLLEAAGLSDQYLDYSKRPAAMQIRYE